MSELSKFHCQSCSEATPYSANKPAFCSHCGQPFAVFGSVIKNPFLEHELKEGEEDKAAAVSEVNTFKMKPASYYKSKAKAAKLKEVELDDEDDDSEEEGEDYKGDPNYVPGSIKEVSFDDMFDLGNKKNKGVAFSDIISSEAIADEQPKPKSAPAPKRRGRKKKS